ncbi:hypothetical protein ABZP36_033643 [Zizania latifolia]
MQGFVSWLIPQTCQANLLSDEMSGEVRSQCRSGSQTCEVLLWLLMLESWLRVLCCVGRCPNLLRLWASVLWPVGVYLLKKASSFGVGVFELDFWSLVAVDCA